MTTMTGGRELAVVASVLIAIVFSVLGCPPSSSEKKTTGSAKAACAKVGDSCEFSPGKLGTCVQKDDCPDKDKAACFVCQSQH